MMDDTPVKASWFYMDESEKIKLNWFLFEYACTLYSHIKRSNTVALNRWKSRRSNKQLAEFSAYLAKRMRQSVYDMLESRTDVIVGDEEYICDYCHGNTHEENDAIMDVAEDAWGELLEICSACATHCISERDEYCTMFDEMETT